MPGRLLVFAAALGFSLILSLLLSIVVGVGTAALDSLSPKFARGLVLAALVEAVVYVAASLIVTGLVAPPNASVELRRPRGRLRELALVRSPLALSLLAMGLGFALHGPADFVDMSVQSWFRVPPSEFAARAARLLPPTTAERVALFVAVVALVPLVEELFFRGALFRVVERSAGASAALVTSAVCFTVSHAEPKSFAALALVATVIGYLRMVTGSLVPCIFLHAAFNATTLLALFVGPPELTLAPPRPSLPLLAVGSVLSGLLLVSITKRSVRAKASSA